MNTNTILVCDDDKEIVDAIEIYLSQEGYQILKAYDGLQAVNMMEKHEIQLLIIDIMMPKLDGIHATLKIREYSSIPIIFLCEITAPALYKTGQCGGGEPEGLSDRRPGDER